MYRGSQNSRPSLRQLQCRVSGTDGSSCKRAHLGCGKLLCRRNTARNVVRPRASLCRYRRQTGNVTYVAYARSEDLPEDGAVLCIARYDGGRMTAYRVLPLNAQNRAGTCTLDGSGTEYRLFLLSPEYCPIAVQRMIQET